MCSPETPVYLCILVPATISGMKHDVTAKMSTKNYHFSLLFKAFRQTLLVKKGSHFVAISYVV